MAKRGNENKSLPDNLKKRMVPKRPIWDLGLVPAPDDPEKFQEFGRNAKLHFDKCDQREAVQDCLMDKLLKHLGCDPGDYKTGFLRLAELYVPAFKTPEKRGARSGRRDARLKTLRDDVERIKREEGIKTDTKALQRLYPDLKKVNHQAELRNKKNQLSEEKRRRPPAR